MQFLRQSVIIVYLATLSHCYWPPGNFQQFGMQHNPYFHNSHDSTPQNYHYQQMNGNQLVNHNSNCNCIKLKYCYPVMEMASKMYTGFIADYINSHLQVMACNYPDGEMAVCCPKNQLSVDTQSRDKQGKKHSHVHHGQGHEYGHGHSSNDGKWIWDTEDITSSEEVHSKHPAPTQYPMNMFTSYPIQGFYPFSKSTSIGYSFFANHEDPSSKKNCPEPFLKEFTLPKNHTFFMKQKKVTTAVSTVEIVTTAKSAQPTTETPRIAETKASLINTESCGRSVGSRIISGQDAGVGRFSWMGRLAYRNKTSGRISYRCAGTLISDLYILTASHCVSNLIDQIELVLVRLGDVDSEQDQCIDDSFCSKEEDFEIDRIITHPNYNNPRYANDIALIRLKESTASSNTIGPICLPTGQYEQSSKVLSAGSNGIVAGWGVRTRATDAQSQRLQWIRLPFVDTSECASFYANYTSNFRTRIMISNSQLCVQGRENGDACAGDSGGPLMNEAEISDSRFVLLGLVSFGPRSCGLSNFPGVYTKASSYIPWILNNIEG